MSDRKCAICNSTKFVDTHHVSYDPPLTIYLCRGHHKLVHFFQTMKSMAEKATEKGAKLSKKERHDVAIATSVLSMLHTYAWVMKKIDEIEVEDC